MCNKNDHLKVTDALWNEVNKKRSPEGNRKATGVNIEYPIMELMLSIAKTHDISKSAILRCFMIDGLALIKSNKEVDKMNYEGMGHYTSMLEPSIIKNSMVISKASKATKSNVMRHCVLLGLKNYLEMNKPYTVIGLKEFCKSIPNNEILNPKVQEKPKAEDESGHINTFLEEDKPLEEGLEDFNKGYIESIEGSEPIIDPKKPQSEEDLQRTVAEPIIDPKGPVITETEEVKNITNISGSKFDKFMESAVKSMKDHKPNKVTFTITFE
ncbi:MAG: hypothetical protein ABUK08_00205 [Candidatus Humimicrobiaceae bacterium]